MSAATPRAGLYLHVPFCARVCPYCDFAVRTGDRARRRRYVDHLLGEIALYAGWPESFDTVYFGGGTPSLLEPDDLGRVLEALRARLRPAPDTQVFLEANPEDLTPALAAELAAIGVTTLSLGVQSLDARNLEFLGRRHDPAGARRAVEAARHAGFRTVSIDLIYGLPGQSAGAWRAELDRVLALEPDHLSCYQLTIHERTRFRLLERRGRLVQLSADRQGELFRLTHRHMSARGMQGYEVSQFAREPGHRSRHNAKYWDHTPYLGLGPAAHSFDGRRRWWNPRRTDPWQERVAAGQRPIEDGERLSPAALALEALMTGLRLHEGVDLERVRRRWGVDVLGPNGTLIAALQRDGLLERCGSRLVPTLEGMAVADGLAPLFELPPAGGGLAPAAEPASSRSAAAAGTERSSSSSRSLRHAPPP